MRCSYRCNMWCDCKKPAKPYPSTPSISAPSESEITLNTESHWIYFGYTPTDATLNVTIESNNTNIAYPSDFSYQNGQAQFLIVPVSGVQGTAGITIVNNDNPEETYEVVAHVEPSEPFNPTNSIYVTKDIPGEAVQTKSRKSKKTLATAVGEEYQAKMFAVDSSSANYVLMKWIYGGDAYIDGYYGSANNEYTTNLFNDQAVLNKIAREIEDYDNKQVLGDNIAKFSGGTWYRMESYFNNVYSPEVAQAIQGYIVEYGGTRFVTPYFNPEISDTSGNVGETVTIRGWKPDGGGLIIRDQAKMVYVEGGNVGEENYNYYMTYQLLSEGTSAVGFQMYDGFTGTIDVTAYPGSTPVEHISSTVDHIAIFEDEPYGNFYFNYSPTTASYPRNEIEVAYSGDISDAYMEDYVTGRGRIIVYPTDVQQGSGIVTVTHTSSGETFDVSVTIGGAHVESIGEPSESSVTLNIGDASNNISIGQSPAEVADASRDVRLYTDNENVAQIRWADTTYGYICIYGINPGYTQVHYWLDSNPGTMYTIDVTVEEPTPTPGYVVNEHTMVYAPLKDTLNGEDGDGNIITPDTLRLGATLEDETARFDANGALRYNLNTTISVTPMTVSIWVKPSFLDDWLIAWYHENWTNVGVANDNQWFTTDIQGWPDYPWGTANESWNLLTIVYDNQNSTQEVYINGQSVGARSYSYNVSQINKIYLGARGYNDNNIQSPWNGYVSDFIIEDVAWDAQMVSEYYEATKNNYPYVAVESLSYVPQSIVLAETETPTYSIQYLPTNAERVTEQIRVISSDDSIAQVLQTWKTYDGEFNFVLSGIFEGTTELSVYLNDSLQATIPVTVTPFVYVESISQGETTATVATGGILPYAIPITPSVVTNCENDITIVSDDDSIAAYSSWQDPTLGTFYIYGVGVGTTQLHYYLNSDPETVYDIDVTVTAPEAHYDLYNNNTVSSEGSWNLNDINTTGYISGDLQATDFNNGYMETYDVLDNTLLGSQDFSMGAWVKLRSLPTGNNWISMLCTGEPNSNYNAVIGYSQGQVYLGGWQNDRATGYTLSTGVRYHLVMTHSNGTAKLYVNGNLEYEANDVNFNIQSGHFVIGSNLSRDGQFVDGCMNEVFIANREYTDQEIATIYSNSAASHEEMVWVYFQSNDDAKGTLNLSQLQVPTGSSVVVSGNTVTIDGTTVTATPNSGNFFFGFTDVPSAISGDEYITANFFAEGETPELTWDFNSITSDTYFPISIPGYKVSQIEFSGTTGNISDWSGQWFAIGNRNDSWFGTAVQTGQNESYYNTSYYGEIRENGLSTIPFSQANLGYGYTPTSFTSVMTKDSITYNYGENTTTYNFNDYSASQFIKGLLARADLFATISPSNSVCNNAQVVVQYEPATTVTQLDNVQQSLNIYKNFDTFLSFDYSPADADIVDINIQSNNENVATVVRQQGSNGAYQYSVRGVEDGQTRLSVYLNGTLDSNIDVTISTEHVQTLNGFFGGNSIIIGQGYNKDKQLDISPNPVSNVSDDVTVTIDDDSIATIIGWSSLTNGIFAIDGVSEGTTQVHAYLNSEPSNVYDLDVEVTSPLATYALGQSLAEDDDKYSGFSGNPQFTTVGNANCMFLDNSQIIQNYEMLAGFLDGIGDFSVNLWVNPTDLSLDYNNFFEFGTGSSYSLAGLMYHSGTLWICGYQNDRDTGATLPLNQWSMITLTHSQGTANVYVNGALVYTDATMNWDITNSGHFVLGGSVGGIAHYTGYMNDLMVTNQLLDAQMIANEYAQEAPNHVITPIASISNVSQDVQISVGDTSTIKVFDYLPTDANVDNVIFQPSNLITYNDYILDNGEYKIDITAGSTQGTGTIDFEFDGTSYSIPLTVNPGR